jgi:ketosteroid isomerase-like protein
VHRTAAAAAALLVLAACKVAPTPQQYLDPSDPAAVERSESEQDIVARVGAFREALARGDRANAVAALGPTADTYVMGVDFNGGRPRYGAQGIADALGDLRLPTGAVARTPDLRVHASTREGGLAWFATHVEVLPVVGAGGEPQWLRASGVFTRHEGDWRLLQLHLSRAELPASADSVRAAAAADSTAGDSATAGPAASR